MNIAEDSFNPKEHNNVSYDDAMSTIHAISADGKTVKGVVLLDIPKVLFLTLLSFSAGAGVMGANSSMPNYALIKIAISIRIRHRVCSRSES